MADEPEMTREELAEHNAYLQALLDGRAKDAYLLSLGPREDGTFGFDIRNSLVPLMAEHLAQMFKASGGENYVEMELFHEELGRLILTLRRGTGKMPSQVASEAKAERDNYRSLLTRAVTELAAAGCDTAAYPVRPGARDG